jgi:dienelactone hydrolase
MRLAATMGEAPAESSTRASSAIAAGASPPSARPSGDAAFDLPPFPTPPLLVPVQSRRGGAAFHADLTYRKVDGREIAGWGAELYLPAQPDTPADGDRRGSAGDCSGAEGDRAPVTGGVRPAAVEAGLPLVVVLPVGGFRKDQAPTFARAFARRGFAALRLRLPPPESDEGVLHSLGGTSRTVTEDASNLRRVLSWAATLPQVDPERIGVFGVSRGAIGAALAAQLDPRLSCVLVLGGADLPNLFSESRTSIVMKMREREVRRAGGDLERAVQKARRILRNVDPATREGRIDPARTLLVNARWDHVIPRKQALALRRAAGGARQEWLPCGHYGALLFARWVRRLAAEHFDRTLRALPPPTVLRRNE